MKIQVHFPVARRLAVRLALALASLCVAGLMSAGPSLAWWQPPAKPTWYWQLTGKINNNQNVDVYDIDGFENGAEEVATLRALTVVLGVRARAPVRQERWVRDPVTA